MGGTFTSHNSSFSHNPAKQFEVSMENNLKFAEKFKTQQKRAKKFNLCNSSYSVGFKTRGAKIKTRHRNESPIDL